ADAVDLAQATLGGQLLEWLGSRGDAAGGATVRPQAVAQFARHLETLGDLFEQARHGQVAVARGHVYRSRSRSSLRDCHPEPAKDPLLRLTQREADPSSFLLRMTCDSRWEALNWPA